MKKILALLLVVLLVSCLISTTALASYEGSSPEQGNTDIETEPTSPQTGGVPVWLVVTAAAVLGGAALVLLRKALA